MTWIWFLLFSFCHGFELKDVKIGIFRPVQNNSLAFLDDLVLQRFSEILYPSPIHRRTRLQKRFVAVDIEEDTELIPQQENWLKRQLHRLWNALWNRKLSNNVITVDRMECPICYRESDDFEGVIETKCGHQFCPECVSVMNQDGTREMKCPYCRNMNKPLDLNEFAIVDRQEQSLLLQQVIGQPWMSRIICHSKKCFFSVLVTLTCAAEFTLVTGLSCNTGLWNAPLTEKWAKILTPTVLSSLSFLTLSIPVDKITDHVPSIKPLMRFFHPFMTAAAGMTMSGVQNSNLIATLSTSIGIAGYHRFRDIGLNTISFLFAGIVLQDVSQHDIVNEMSPLSCVTVFGLLFQMFNYYFIPWEKVFGSEMTFFNAPVENSGSQTMALVRRCQRNRNYNR